MQKQRDMIFLKKNLCLKSFKITIKTMMNKIQISRFTTNQLGNNKLTTLTTKILGFSNGPSWLISLSWLMNMYILIRGQGFEWHVYLLTRQHGWNDLFDYLLIWTFSQIEHKIDNIGQNGQWCYYIHTYLPTH